MPKGRGANARRRTHKRGPRERKGPSALYKLQALYKRTLK